MELGFANEEPIEMTSRWRFRASDTRMPVTASNPNRVL